MLQKLLVMDSLGIKLKDINILGAEKLMKTLPVDIVKDLDFLKSFVGSIINLCLTNTIF